MKIALAALALWLWAAVPLALGQRTLYFRDVFTTHLPLKAFGAATDVMNGVVHEIANRDPKSPDELRAAEAETLDAMEKAGHKLPPSIAIVGGGLAGARTAVELRAGSRLLLDAASFRVAPGDRVGLVGRNGAGKTTLTKALAGV